jgi:hypothetical protein
VGKRELFSAALVLLFSCLLPLLVFSIAQQDGGMRIKTAGRSVKDDDGTSSGNVS